MAPLVETAPTLGWWVTGLTDGEGCFYAGMVFRSKGTSASRLVSCVELDARFQVALRQDDVDTLRKVQTYFGGHGSLRVMKTRPSAPSRVKQGLRTHNPLAVLTFRDVGVLVERVIPHFDAFPLQSKKLRDFHCWRKIVEFAAAELVGHKGWLRRFPDKVSLLDQMCGDLRQGREFTQSINGGN